MQLIKFQQSQKKLVPVSLPNNPIDALETIVVKDDGTPCMVKSIFIGNCKI